MRKVEGTWGAQFVDQLKPAADEPVVVKYTHDCFYRTDMEALLERLRFRPGEGRIIVTEIAARGSERKTSGIFSIHELRLPLQRDRYALRFDRILDLSFVSGPLLRAIF